MTGRALTILAISTNPWKTIQRDAHLIVDAIDGIVPGSFVEVDFKRS